MADTLIEIAGISKAFSGVRALTDVSMDIARGEVHALVGENGAGKSTLIKILSGYYVPDQGEVRVEGRALRLGHVAASEAAGIAVIHQEAMAFPHLDARDNLFVGREPRRCFGLLLDRRRMRRETDALLSRLGEHPDPGRPIGDLPLAQRQMVGIARALSCRSRLLIMDEPTSSLSERETRILFRVIRGLRESGVSILYVSHRLGEVFELADRVTVLRDGQRVDTLRAADVSPEGLVRMMVGRSLPPSAPRVAESAAAPPLLLEVRGLTREGAFRRVSLAVRAGEIVGLAGLVGAGRTELSRAIFGMDRPDAGTVRIGGSILPPGSVRAAIGLGVALVPEDRQKEGLILPMSVRENLTLTVMRSLTRRGLFSRRLEDAVVGRQIRDLDVRASDPSAAAETLSGGNQQKLVLGKWLTASPRVLILDEPTRGIDVGAKAQVHQIMLRLAREGAAILLISSELPEILAMSDRVLVMRSGAISGELSRAEATEKAVLSLALPRDAEGSAEEGSS